VVLLIGVALVAALVIRQATSTEALRRLALVAAVALGIRLAALTVIYFIAIRTHAEGTFFNDEASFYLAAESLLPNPLDQPLPQGLDHLGTDGYLGILWGLSVALGSSFGHMDTVAFRLVNATLGALVAVTCCVVAAQLINRRAALLAGLVVALWPTLVLWSATLLRDTLASFSVVVVWWTLTSRRRVLDARVVATVAVALLLLAGVRPYLAGAVAIGAIGWAAWPLVRGASPRVLAPAAVAVVLLGGIVVARQSVAINQLAHVLVYRQLTTRLETLGLLYRDVDPSDPPQEPPFGPGTAVATIDSSTGWAKPGLIEKPLGPGVVLVAAMDGSESPMRIADLTLLQSAPLSPLQVVASIGPGVISFATGTSSSGDQSNAAWTADALAWDVLFVLAIIGGVRARVPAREWIFPACVVLGTAAALIAVPGAPGNDDRHRAAQAVPFLVVFAAGWLGLRAREAAVSGVPVSSAASSPISAGIAAISRSLSLR
jgi:hypothetical protein